MLTAFKIAGYPAWAPSNAAPEACQVKQLASDVLASMSGYWCEQIISHHIFSERSPNKDTLARLAEHVRGVYFDFVDVWWQDASSAEKCKSEVSRVLDGIIANVNRGLLPPYSKPSSSFVPNEIMIHPDAKFGYRDLITQEAVRLTNTSAPIALGPVLWEIVRLIYMFKSDAGAWHGEIDELSLLYWVGRLFSVCVCGLHARNHVIRYMAPYLKRSRIVEIESEYPIPMLPRTFDEVVLAEYAASKEEAAAAAENYRAMSLINALHESIRVDARSLDGQARHDAFGLAASTPQFSDAYYVTLCINSVPLLTPGDLEVLLYEECIAPNVNSGNLRMVRNAFEILKSVQASWRKSKGYVLMNKDEGFSPLIHPSPYMSIVHEASEIVERHIYTPLNTTPKSTRHAVRAAIHLSDQARYMMNAASTMAFTTPTAESLKESSDVPRDWWACFLLFWSIYSSRLSSEFCKSYIGDTSVAALTMSNLHRTKQQFGGSSQQHYAQVDPTSGKRAPVGMLAIRDFLTYAANSPSLRKHRCAELTLVNAVARSYLTDPTMDTMLAVLKSWLFAETGLTICDFLYTRVNVLGIYNKR